MLCWHSFNLPNTRGERTSTHCWCQIFSNKMFFKSFITCIRMLETDCFGMIIQWFKTVCLITGLMSVVCLHEGYGTDTIVKILITLPLCKNSYGQTEADETLAGFSSYRRVTFKQGKYDTFSIWVKIFAC